MKFTDLQFNSHPNYPDTGVQAKHFFDNGYGVSVVSFPGSYGFRDGLYESAVLKKTEEDWHICYDSVVADDVLGYQTEEEVEVLLYEIENL
jgi:hypothetical protein